MGHRPNRVCLPGGCSPSLGCRRPPGSGPFAGSYSLARNNGPMGRERDARLAVSTTSCTNHAKHIGARPPSRPKDREQAPSKLRLTANRGSAKPRERRRFARIEERESRRPPPGPGEEPTVPAVNLATGTRVGAPRCGPRRGAHYGEKTPPQHMNAEMEAPWHHPPPPSPPPAPHPTHPHPTPHNPPNQPQIPNWPLCCVTANRLSTVYELWETQDGPAVPPVRVAARHSAGSDLPPENTSRRAGRRSSVGGCRGIRAQARAPWVPQTPPPLA